MQSYLLKFLFINTIYIDFNKYKPKLLPSISIIRISRMLCGAPRVPSIFLVYRWRQFFQLLTTRLTFVSIMSGWSTGVSIKWWSSRSVWSTPGATAQSFRVRRMTTNLRVEIGQGFVAIYVIGAGSRIVWTLAVITLCLMMRIGTLIVETVRARFFFFDLLVLGGRALLGILGGGTDRSEK